MAEENNNLKTIDIKGKKYVEVKTRVLELHRQNDSFSMTTEIIYDDDNKVVMQTRLKIDNRIFTGIASENKDQASPYENCETSSVGRCIGFYGIGIIESIESSDGMTKYHNNKEHQEPKPATERQINAVNIINTKKDLGMTENQLKTMTRDEASKIISGQV